MNGWWWYWNNGPGVPEVAARQPPEYHFHEIPALVSRSPMLGYVASSISGIFAPDPAGVLDGWTVLTAKSPQALRYFIWTGSLHLRVSCPSLTGPVGV